MVSEDAVSCVENLKENSWVICNRSKTDFSHRVIYKPDNQQTEGKTQSLINGGNTWKRRNQKTNSINSKSCGLNYAVESLYHSLNTTLRSRRTHHSEALASPAMGHWGTCPLDFQLFNFFGHFRAVQTLESRTLDSIRDCLYPENIEVSSFVTVYCMNLIILLCVTQKLSSQSFVSLLARIPGDATVQT